MADITFECPECEQRLAIDSVHAGSEVQCPACSKSISVSPPIAQANRFPSILINKSSCKAKTRMREIVKSISEWTNHHFIAALPKLPQIKSSINRFMRNRMAVGVTLAGFCLLALILCCYTHERTIAMEKATWTCWSEIQTAESNVSSDGSEDPAKRAYYYTLINTEGVDPSLAVYIADAVEKSKKANDLETKIRNELATNQRDIENTKDLYDIAGTVAGSLADNGRSMQENMEAGEQAGEVSGLAVDLLNNALLPDEIHAKYGDEINQCNADCAELKADRAALSEYLSKKYGAEFLNAY